MAKEFEKQHNQKFNFSCIKKIYLDKVDSFLRDQIKKSELPDELQPLAADLKLEIKNIMKEFQNL